MIESASVGAGEGSARVVSRNPGSWARRYCSVSHGCGTQAGLVNRSGSRTRSLCAAPMPVWPHQIAASPTPGTVICRSAMLTSLPSPALLTRHMAETRRGRAAPVGGRPGRPRELPTRIEAPRFRVSRNSCTKPSKRPGEQSGGTVVPPKPGRSGAYTRWWVASLARTHRQSSRLSPSACRRTIG